MNTYVALLRGINSGQNSSQKMENLRNIFEDLGFENVRSVIATGNILFESTVHNQKTLEKQIEKALHAATGIETATIIRTKEEIQHLVTLNPFKNVNITPHTKPHVTFLKDTPEYTLKLPLQGKGYTILAMIDYAVCSIVDLSGATTSDVMRVLDRKFGKTITTRTWNTVKKIAAP